MGDKEELLAFVHVEKAAGTTFIHILRRNYLFKYIDARPYYPESRGLFAIRDLLLARKIVPGLSCIAGHSVKPYSNLDQSLVDVKYITILRDPVKRYVSQYQYWLERMGKKLTFEEFLDTEEVRNFQTKKFDRNGDIENAKNVLKDKIMLVGLVEQFDEFLILLKNKLSSSLDFDPHYKQQNLARNKVKTSDIFESYRDRIEENNLLDIQLYNYAKDTLFPEYIREYGAAYLKDVELFKSENSNLGISMYKRYVDYGLRKIYIEPITSLIRLGHGMEAKGSY